MLTYLLSVPLCLQQDLLVVRALFDATLAAHRHFVLPAVINQRLSVANAQQHAHPHLRLSARGGRAVCSLGEDRQGRVSVQAGPGGKLCVADGTLWTHFRHTQGVPVNADAALAEGVATGDGYRDMEAFQTYGAG